MMSKMIQSLEEDDEEDEIYYYYFKIMFCLFKCFPSHFLVEW